MLGGEVTVGWQAGRAKLPVLPRHRGLQLVLAEVSGVIASPCLHPSGAPTLLSAHR